MSFTQNSNFFAEKKRFKKTKKSLELFDCPLNLQNFSNACTRAQIVRFFKIHTMKNNREKAQIYTFFSQSHYFAAFCVHRKLVGSSEGHYINPKYRNRAKINVSKTTMYFILSDTVHCKTKKHPEQVVIVGYFFFFKLYFVQSTWLIFQSILYRSIVHNITNRPRNRRF